MRDYVDAAAALIGVPEPGDEAESVVLPAPEGPTIAVIAWAGASRISATRSRLAVAMCNAAVGPNRSTIGAD